MADVTFYGLANASRFGDSDVEILPANPATSQPDEVKFGGIGASAPGGLATESNTFSPTLTPRPEFTEVTFFTPQPPPPAIDSPNQNELVFFVVGGPTSGAQFVNVRVVAAPFELNGQVNNPSLVAIDLRLFTDAQQPSGIVGKIAEFSQPTGATQPVNIKGVTGRIRTIGGIEFAPGTPTNSALTRESYLVEFESALPVQPTIGDRFTVKSTNQTLRRSPVLEIFLSTDEEQ